MDLLQIIYYLWIDWYHVSNNKMRYAVLKLFEGFE
jgi:hypothetical protein